MGSLAGVLLCSSVRQAFDGPASLLFSCRCWHVGERGYGDGFTLYAWLSSITLLPWLPRLSSTAISHHDLLPHTPQPICPQSTAPLTLGSLHIPQTPAHSHAAFQGALVPVWGLYGCGKDYLFLIAFRLPQISCFTLSLKCFSSDSDNCPDVGIGPLLVSPPTESRSSPTHTPVFLPSSFILPSFAWV